MITYLLEMLSQLANLWSTCSDVAMCNLYNMHLQTTAIFLKAKCLPEMRKDRVYLLKMALLKESFDMC